MKKREIICAAGIVAVMLSACQGLSRATVAETYWREAGKASDLETYVKEHKDEMDMAALKQEAESAESTLSQKFKAVVLMCSLEYEKDGGQEKEDSWKEGMYRFDFPETSDYAGDFLANVNTQREEFWNSLGEAFSPYDCFWPVVAASDGLTGETLANLLAVPEDKTYGSKLADAVDRWIQADPVKVVDIGEDLKESGYYDDWSADDWSDAYVYDYGDPYKLHVATIDEALEYIGYVKDTIIPQHLSDDSSLRQTSEIMGKDMYKTQLAVTVDEALDLKEPGQELPEVIDLEGKKVIAFYRNPQTEEFPGSATPLQVLGDFMMELSDEERPSSAAEADYYLVLTCDMEDAGVYQTMGGSDTQIGMVYSSTSVDLYEASTGNFLKHLGTVTELPPERIFANYGDNDSRYQEITGCDILHYIYRNLNDPMIYASLVDNTAGKGDLAKDESIIVGKWEVAYHGADIVPSYEKGMYRYDAEDGCVLVKCSFTVTNRGLETDSFMPIYSMDSEDTFVQLMDRDTEEIYTNMNVLTDSDCLNNKSLEPGESAEGILVYQMPEGAAQNRESLALAVASGIQLVYYPLD